MHIAIATHPLVQFRTGLPDSVSGPENTLVSQCRLLAGGVPRTHPLTTLLDDQQAAVATSAPTQPATRGSTYRGLYQTITEARQNG